MDIVRAEDFTAEDFAGDDEGAEVRTLDIRDRQVGLFGDWLERSGYGKNIEWVQNAEQGNLWELRAVREVRAREPMHCPRFLF